MHARCVFDIEGLAELLGWGLDLLLLNDCAPLKSLAGGDDLIYAS